MTSRRIRRLRPKGWGWISATAAAFIALDTANVRRRVAALPHINPDTEKGSPPGARRYQLMMAPGVEVPPASHAAAVAYADSHELDVLELVPEDLDAERLFTLARWMDPATYRDDRLSIGHGAYQALLVEETTLERIGHIPPGPVPPADFVSLVREAKRCAPVTSDLAVVSGVRAAADRPKTRRATLRARAGAMSGVAIWAPPLTAVGLTASGALAPGWGLAALVTYALQPTLAFRGTPHAHAAPFPGQRVASAPIRMVRTVAARDANRDSDPAVAEASAVAREECQKILSQPIERFFEARRSTCPWCDGSELRSEVVCEDDLQGKPGTFRLDRCLECGHVFQNPRLSLEGLDFYYRDFYDGEGEDQLAAVFDSGSHAYRSRARLASRVLPDPPARWLDVGAGHGHFCLVAAEIFPTTRFEALDMSDGIATGERRRWVARAHRGLFPDLAGQLAEQFDVVSMFHYLEHSRDPRAELEAARRVLRPGGHLVVEVPDPECAAGRLLGRWWGPWFQPQHQHLMPLDNLSRALRTEGFQVQAVERTEAHQPLDASLTLWLLLNHLAPPPGKPWRDSPSRWERIVHGVVFVLGAPLLALALIADQLTGPLIARLRHGSNAYRLIAQRAGQSDG